MLASFNACAQGIGILEGADLLKSDIGSWDIEYRKFFLDWYYGKLLFHGERISTEAKTIFRGIEVQMSAKVATVHYDAESPVELTPDDHYTFTTVNFLQIARMLARYGFGLCCTWLEMLDPERKQVSVVEGFLRQLVSAARLCNVPLEGQSTITNFQDRSFEQVLRMSKYCADGLEKHSFSFNFVRMDKNMFEHRNWVRFTRFVRQMSVSSSIFRARLKSCRYSYILD